MLIYLKDYFAPLWPFGLLYFFLLFSFFDVLGTFVRNKIFNESDRNRILNWLMGFGIFIFFWFVLSLFIPYKKPAVIVSILILLFVFLPSYIKNKHHVKLIRSLWRLKIPILVILPLLPSVFIKASLPPYYGDEMAYHFMAPTTLNNLSVIRYTGGLYQDLPRIMNLFYELVFSLTRSYSAARLLHFTILATSMLFAFELLKRNFGKFTGFLFVFIFFSLPQDIVLTSTLGYIDVAAYSFMLIAVLSTLDFLLTKNTNSLLLSAIFWAMNLGTKYTGVSAFISFIIVLSSILVIRRKEFWPILQKKLFIKIFILGTIFGGYWYIKNLITFGNPIFPFILPCFEKYAEICQTGGGFFGDWTMPVTRANIFPIIQQLFSTNKFLQIFILSVPIFFWFVKGKNTKLALVFLISHVAIELIFLKFFSGFLVRYHQHMQFYLLAALVIIITNKNALKESIGKGVVAVLLITSLFTYIFVVRNSNSLGFLNWYEIKYSTGRINIYDWIDWKYPEMKEMLDWCENPPEGVKTPVARFDPDLIWFDPAGLTRAFITNCHYKNPPLEGIALDQVIQKAKSEKLQFWITSTYKCIPDEDVKPKYEYEKDYQFVLRKLNNKIICNSTEIKPNLYYFDYTTLK